MTETIVPIHLPNKIPEKIKIGDPKPNKATQIMANEKKKDYINKKIAAYKIIEAKL
tara:strand:+ start:291 stop:458 length:168 start_codon:yes stop_codon:yes gene_type:complete